MLFPIDREERRNERRAFIRSYAEWVKRTPNSEWSRQQAVLIDSFMIAARDMPLSPSVYLERVIRNVQRTVRSR
jgi:hypothetical protein